MNMFRQAHYYPKSYLVVMLIFIKILKVRREDYEFTNFGRCQILAEFLSPIIDVGFTGSLDLCSVFGHTMAAGKNC